MPANWNPICYTSDIAPCVWESSNTWAIPTYVEVSIPGFGLD